MDTMQKAMLIAHTLIALLIIVLVLMQRGKGADAGAAFGAGASGTVFGARGSSSFFSRATAVLATAFFATSLALAVMSSQRTDAPPTSLLDGVTTESQSEETQELVPAADEDLPATDLPSTELPSTELPSLDEGTDELPAVGDEELPAVEDSDGENGSQ